MIRIVGSKHEKSYLSNIEKSTINLNSTFVGRFNLTKIKKLVFFPDTFILRSEIFELLDINFNFSNLSYLSCHQPNSTMYFELMSLKENEWLPFLEGKFENNSINADFAYFIYSEFICVFDTSLNWFYYHQKDFPNVLIINVNINLNIPKTLTPFILSEQDIFDELEEHLDRIERIQLRTLVKQNIIQTL